MKKSIEKQALKSRTLDSNPRAATQVSVYDLLQTAKNTKNTGFTQPISQLYPMNNNKEIKRETNNSSIANNKEDDIIQNKTDLNNTIQRTKWIWKQDAAEWQEHEESFPFSPAPSRTGFRDGEIVDTAQRVVYATGSRVNEAERAKAHPERTYNVSDLQTEAEVTQYPGYKEAAEELARMGSTNRHGIDAANDTTPSILTHIPFLETGVRDPKSGPLTGQVMHDIFAQQDEFQPDGHIITTDIYTDGTRMGRRYKLSAAASSTDYQLIKRVPLKRKVKHVKTKDKSTGSGLQIDSTNSRRLFFRRDTDPDHRQSEREMHAILTDHEDASDYEDMLVREQQARYEQDSGTLSFDEWQPLAFNALRGIIVTRELDHPLNTLLHMAYDAGYTPMMFASMMRDGTW